MSAPKVGDRVRVTYESTVIATDADGKQSGDKFTHRDVLVGTLPDSGDWYVDPDGSKSDRRLVSVEVLAPPEPDWQPGDVVRLGRRYTRVLDSNGVWRDETGRVQSDRADFYSAESYRSSWIIRGGKPVTA